jgi:hypothetical protein
MVLQAEADGAQGYDFVAYHGYGKRRYFELVGRKSQFSQLLGNVSCACLNIFLPICAAFTGSRH